MTSRTLGRIAAVGGARLIGTSVPLAASPVCPDADYLDFHHVREACHRRYLGEALGLEPA